MKPASTALSVVPQPAAAGVAVANVTATLASVVSPYSASPQISSPFTAAVLAPSVGENYRCIQGDHFSGKPESVREFAVVRELAFCQGNVRKNCYNVCMVWVADTDCDMINAKTLNSVIMVA